MRTDEREFINTRFNDLKDHINSMFETNTTEHKVIQRQVSKNTKFRLISTGSVLTISFLIGAWGFLKFILKFKFGG